MPSLAQAVRRCLSGKRSGRTIYGNVWGLSVRIMFGVRRLDELTLCCDCHDEERECSGKGV